ncbi:glycosyltransferase family 2 protein [Vibrio maritimus]|uniref:glycosyltransferase family 2 protein n=1 Tax=Vibrio maritimus TaxID=990268 RepID=UPI0037365862
MELTIIIPHYNDTKRLKRLLSTIPDSASIQVLVIDDMSDSFAIEDCSSNVELLVNDSGEKGAGVCRNLGIQRALGKWLLFADSDDYFTHDAFEIIKRYLNSESDIVYFSPISEIEDQPEAICQRHIHYSNLVSNFCDHEDIAIRYQFEVPWSKMIKSSLVKKNEIKFDHSMVSNDTFFSLMSGHFANQISATRDPIYCVVERSGSLTKVESKERSLIRLGVVLKTNDYLDSWGHKEYQVSYLRLFYRYHKTIGLVHLIRLLPVFLSKGYLLIPRSLKRSMNIFRK